MWYELSRLSIKKYIKRTIIISGILVVIGNLLIFTNPYNDFDKNYGISVYFNIISINRNVIYFIAYTLLMPSIVLMDYFDYNFNKFNYFIIERIGIREYYKKALLNIFVITILSTLFINLCLLLSIGILWSNISFEPQYIYNLFSENTFINIVIYFILSAIGTAFFSMFMFSIINFINNKYIYRGFISILTFTTIILCTFIAPFIFSVFRLLFNNKTIFKTIIFSIVPSGLLTPGMIFEYYGFLNFVSSLIFYGFAFVMCMIVSEKMRRKNG